jgi:hypothetical protein
MEVIDLLTEREGLAIVRAGLLVVAERALQVAEAA